MGTRYLFGIHLTQRSGLLQFALKRWFICSHMGWCWCEWSHSRRYAQRFRSSDGVTIGSHFKLNNINQTNLTNGKGSIFQIKAVALENGDFAAVWSSDLDNGTSSLFHNIFSIE